MTAKRVCRGLRPSYVNERPYDKHKYKYLLFVLQKSGIASTYRLNHYKFYRKFVLHFVNILPFLKLSEFAGN